MKAENVSQTFQVIAQAAKVTQASRGWLLLKNYLRGQLPGAK